MRSFTPTGQPFFTNLFSKKLRQAKSLIVTISLVTIALGSYAQTTPTAFTAGTITSTSLQFSWTGTPTSDFYIVRNTSATIGNLVDGTTYDLGANSAVAGGGTVVGITALNTFTDNSLSPGTPYFYKIFDHKAPSGPKYSSGLTGTMTTAPAGTITPGGSLTALSTTYGTASSFTSFTVSGSNLGAAGTLLITPPAGFEVADGTILTYGTTLSYTADGAGALASKTVNVRLAATTVPATYSGNISLSNAQSTTVNVATVSSTVNTKALTITGLTGVDKVYDRTNAATYTGAPTLNGVNAPDVVTVGGSPSATFASIGVANGIIITVSGFAPGGGQAAYYTITPPTTSANITPKPLTISGITANDKPFDGTTAATLSGSPTLVGVINPDVVTVSPSAPAGTFSSSAVGTGKAVTVTAGSYVLGGADNANYTVAMPAGLTATITELTTVAQVSGGVAAGATINSSSTTVALLGFSLNNPTSTGNFTGLTLTTTADPSTLFSSVSLVSSTDNTYDAGDPAVTGSFGSTSSTITFTGITGQAITAGATTYYYFLKVTLKPFFSSVNPTIKISFDPTSAITFSNTIAGTGSVINTINGANSSYTLHDDIAPTITSITNSVNPIYQSALTQTVVVHFSETMTNSGFNPVIAFSAGTWPAQAAGSWSQTTFTDDTYTTTFAHSGAVEETQANVTSGISTMTAKDVSGNVVSNTFTSAGNFLLDTQRPTVTVTRNAVSTGTFAQTTDNSVSFNIDFAEPLAAGTFTAADVTVNLGGTTAHSSDNLTGSNNQNFVYTVNNITGDGLITLSFGTAYTDVVGNAPLAFGPSSGFTIDNTVPTVAVTLVSASPSTATSLDFTVTFSESVTGVDMSDFVLATGTANDATGTVSNLTGSGAVYTVTVSSLDADYASGTQGILNLDIVGSPGIADAATNPFGGSFTADNQYLVDNNKPTVVSNSFTFNANGAGAETITFTVSEPLNGSLTNNITGFTITGATGNGTTAPTNGSYNSGTNTVTLTNAGSDGTWGASITVSYAPGNMSDLLGNTMAAIGATAVTVPSSTLQAGDIAFTGFNSKQGTGPADGFSFVILKNLPASTTIYFTNNGWNGSALQTGEQTVTWVSPGSVTNAGTEVYVVSNASLAANVATVGTGTQSAVFNLNSGGDQVLAYQGSLGSPLQFIAAIHVSSDKPGAGTFAADNWNNAADVGTDANRSALPTGLAEGTNALSLSQLNGANVKDNAQYKLAAVPEEGSAQQLRSAMCASANWNNQDNNAYAAGSVTYKIRPVITAVTITNGVNYIIGGPYTAFITVHDDRGTPHALLSSTLDGFTLSNLVRTSSTTYTADFTVVQGGTDVAAASNINISVNLQSAQGNATGAAVIPGGQTSAVQLFTTAIAQANDPIDAHAPTIISITNTLSTIKVGALTQTVTVVYSETMKNTVQPTISLSGGSTHWGAQTPSGGTNGWVGTTYTATFTHDGTPEEIASIQSSVPVGGAQDALGNPNTGTATSAAFVLDTKVPALTAGNITLNKTSVNVTNTGAGSNTIRVTVQYSERMKNTVAPSVIFSNGTFAAGVPVSGGNSGWFTTTFTDDTYKIDFTDNTTTDEFSGVTTSVSGGQDFVGNAQSGSTVSSTTFQIDTKAPTVLSSNLVTTSPTNATSVQFLVTFSETVTGIDVTDFALVNTGTVAGTISGVSVASGSSVSVTVSSITGEGTMALNVKTLGAGATLQDGGTNPVTAGFTGGQAYTIDTTPPTVTSIDIDPAIINAWSVSVNGTTPSLHSNTINYLVNFSEPVSGVTFSDFNGVKAPNGASVINLSPGTITPVGGSPAMQWIATALYTSGSGTFEVDFQPAANSVTAPFVTGTGQITVNNGNGQVNSFSGTNFPAEIFPNYDIYINGNEYVGTVSGSVTAVKFNLQRPAVVAAGSFTGPFSFDPAATNHGTGSGTISANTASATITGTSTTFTNNLTVNDLIFNGSGNQYIGTVQSVTSDVSVQLTLNAHINYSGSYSVRRPSTMAYSSQIKDQAGNLVSTSFKAGPFYDISLPEPSSSVASLTPAPAATSITVNWTDVSGATNYLVMLKNASGTFPVAGTALKDGVFFADDADLSDGVMKLNIAQGIHSATFAGLNSGTPYDFIIYPYALSTDCIVAGDKTAIDYNITTPATIPSTTTTASLSTVLLNSVPVPISSVANASGTGVNVMTFTIYDDGLDPVSPNVMSLGLNTASIETITFTLRDQLTLPEGGSVTGFTSTPGTVASAIYTGKGTTNTITLTSLTGGVWNSSTTISYNASIGNAQFVTLGKMQPIVNHTVSGSKQVFIDNSPGGTFQVPAGVTSIQVEVWGGGGAGGGYSQLIPYNNASSYGGGGGAYSRSILSVTPLATYGYSIGQGGIPVPSTTNCCDFGAYGGATDFGGLVVADGGYGGLSSAYPEAFGWGYYGFTNQNYGGRVSGGSTTGIGDVKFNGGNSGFGSNISPNPGSGGGSSAGTASDGASGANANASPTTSTTAIPGGISPAGGGNGGSGVYSGAGGSGSIPGGGGGGVGNAFSSGAGAPGQVRITYYAPTGSAPSDWAADNSPFIFNQLVVTQGSANNTPILGNWQNVIAGAELSDGTNTVSGTVNSSNISFSAIPHDTNAKLGYIDDANLAASSKTYTLKVWLRTDLTTSLTADVDNLNLDFKVDLATPANITYDVDVNNNNQQSSTIIATQPAVQSGASQVQVVATGLAFTTQPLPTSQLVLTNFATAPVVRAVDKNGNTDHGFTGIAVSFTNTGTIAMNPGNATPFLITSSAGVINFPANFQYTDQGVGTLIANSPVSAPYPALSSTSAPSTGAVACSIINVTYTNGTTVTGGTGTPNISSIASSNVPVFSFTVTDDGGAGGDGAATKIKTLKFTPNASDFFGLASAHNNFQDLIASATITDNSGIPANTMTITSANGINANDITFSAIPFAAGNLGNVADNAAKIYTLSIIPKTTLTGGLPSTADNKNLVLDLISNTNIILDATGSTIPVAAPPVNSGASNGVFQVFATKLAFTTEPPVQGAGSYLVSTALSTQPPIPVVEALDINNNRDLDYAASITTSCAVGVTPISLSSQPTAFTNGIITNTTFGAMSATAIATGAKLRVHSTVANLAIIPAVPSDAVSTAFDVKVGQASTISTPLALGNIPSTATSATAGGSSTGAVPVFSFKVNDDAAITPNDGNPTLVTQITFKQSATQNSATLLDWTQAIAGAILSDGTNSQTVDFSAPVNGALTANSITFSNIIITSGQLGYINDSPNPSVTVNSKTYTLKIWLKTSLGGTLPFTIDGKTFGFDVQGITASDIQTDVNGSSLSSGTALTPSGNTVNVVADHLAFTNPNAATGASIGVSYQPGGLPVKAYAEDVNSNVDLDFTGIIRALTNVPGATMLGTGGITIGTSGSGIQFGTTAFSSGSFTFPTAFEFSTGTNGQNVALTLTAGASGACDATTILCGSTPTITLITAFESSLVGDPTFPPFGKPVQTIPVIDYVYHQENANIQNTNTSYELLRALLVDGSRGSSYIYNNGTTTAPLQTSTDSGDGLPDDDIDGASTDLTSITVRIYKPSTLRRIALYGNGVEIPGTELDATTYNNGTGLITSSTPYYDFTWSQGAGTATNPILLSAGDHQEALLSIRVSFRNTSPELNDGDNIQVDLIATTLGSGSQFYKGDGPDGPNPTGTGPGTGPIPGNNPGPYIGGQTHNGGPGSVGIIDVVTTKFDFMTQPVGSSFEGIIQPIAVHKVEAHDQFGLLDTGFNSTVSVSGVSAGVSTPTTPFIAGKLDLTSMQFVSAGDGTLTIDYGSGAITSNLNNTVGGLTNAAVTCNHIDVIDVGASYNSNSVVTASNLKGGTNAVIFGADITPAYFVSTFKGDATNEPSLTSLTFSFDVPFKTSGYTAYTAFHVFESTSGTFSGATNVTSIGGTVTPAGSNQAVTVTFSTPRPLYTSGSQPSPTRSYFLTADVSNTATNNTPKITAQLIDIGYGDNSISVTQGSSSANVIGKQFGFASTKPPSLVGATCSPFSGQLNVDPGITEIDLTFDVPVLTFDGVAYLYDRSAPNAPVAQLSAINGNFVPSTSLSSLTVNPIRFSIPTGTVLLTDHVYYVTIPQGTFDPTANGGLGAGTGISDDQTNLYGGISYNGTMYFKIVSNYPPNMISTDVTTYNVSTTVASLNASFDQRGTAYYLILDHANYATGPTSGDINNPASYALANPGAVITNGNFNIGQLSPNLQYFSIPGNWTSTIIYDVWIYAQNDATLPLLYASAPYGSKANSYAAGSAGPTFQFKQPLNPGIPVYQICPNSYSILSEPILITETVANKWAIGAQDFNILLPTGFDFDINYAPTITLVGSDFVGSATSSFINSTLLNISFTNSGVSTLDRIIISNFRVTTNGASTSPDIKRFAGNGLTDVPNNTVLAKISGNALQPQAFTNSYTNYNNFGSSINLTSVVTSIPDNFIDQTLLGKNATQLIPTITPSNDFNASFFGGAGVTNDVLSLTGVAKNTAFDITMTHTDLNGCFLSQTAQYLVYDHTNIIPALTDPVYGPNTCLTNSNFVVPSDVALGTTSPAFISPTLGFSDIAGYKLDSMVLRVPLEATAASQIIYGPGWQNQLDKVLKRVASVQYAISPNLYYRSYQWDYAHILNAKIESGGAVTLNPYDNFIQHTPINSNNFTGGNQPYYTGGSLGFVDFIGKFESTADLSVYQPLVQRVQLFVPAIPVVEVVGQSSVIPAGAGAPPIYVFCQLGSDILFNAYPAASPGKSAAYYSLYDDATNTVLYNGLTGNPSASGFTDNANSNGTATLKPNSPAFINGNKTIRVEYTYQDNNSPCPGIGKFYIQIAPNPVANFNFSSIPLGTNSPNASNASAICANNQIDFAATINNPNYTYIWNFGDPNSASNAPAPTLGLSGPSHTFALSSTYNVSLDLISDFNCPSIPQGGVIVGSEVIPVKVGDNPVPGFGVTKNCVGDLITFDASVSSVSGNSTINAYNWDYNFQTPPNGLPNPSPAIASLAAATGASTTYSKPGFYNVLLTTITTLGCQRSNTNTISQLDVISAFNNNFDVNDGGWQTIDLANFKPGAGDPQVSWAWGNSIGRTNSVFDSPTATNKMWVTTAVPNTTTGVGFYNPLEKSALYSACLNLDSLIVPRPMISYSSFVDVSTGDGLVLQYSTDDLNILDTKKVWTNLGGIGTGLDWYTNVGLPSNPGSNNSSGIGWSGNGKEWIHPKHKLDDQAKITQKVILRFALSSVASSTINSNTNKPYDGVAVDSIFFGSRTRTILFENFTTTDDGGSATLKSDLIVEADSISAFVKRTINKTQLVNINYHVGFIGQDPFSMDDPADPSSRALYYNVKKVPYAFLDGIHYRDSTKTPPSDLFKDWGQKEYDLNTLQLAKADFMDPVNPTTVEANSDGSIQVDVNFTPLFNLPYSPIANNTQVKGGTVLQVAILEKAISTLPTTGKITTGETSFGYVLKKMVPNAAGTKFTNAITAGVPVSAGSFKWIPEKLHSANAMLTVVVFLQNEDTKEVYQAFVQDIAAPAPVTEIQPLTADQIKIYPNPSDQEFTLELPSPAQQSMRITVANQVGQFTEVGSIGEGEQSKKISTQGLAEGVYILQLGSNGNALRTKIVVLHK